MGYPKRELVVVPESIDDETGEETTWAIHICDNHFLWIEKQDENEYAVVDSDGNNRAGRVFKTLWGAKRCAEAIAWRQEETGFFSD